MNFWQKDIVEAADEGRAERIIQKKRRKQDPKASGLGAVAIPRMGPRAIHQRHEDRHVLRGKATRAMLQGEEIEASLLNLSSNGVMIACRYPVSIGDEIAIAIEDCAPITTAVRWARDGRIGLEFIAETEIIADAGVRDLIINTIRKEADQASYGPSKLIVGSERRTTHMRHNLLWMGKLKSDGREATCRLRNVSGTGAMVSTSTELVLSENQQVVLSLAEAGDIRGRVRWHSGQEVGVQFDAPFDVALLVHEACAELAPEDRLTSLGIPRDDSLREACDLDSLHVRLGKVSNPHQPPDLEYGRLTLEEVYRTLYPERGSGDESEASSPPSEADEPRDQAG